MSDTMLLGVLRMPFDLAMATPTSRIQYHQRGVQAADEIEKLTRERNEARSKETDYREGFEEGWDAAQRGAADVIEKLTRERDEARAEIERTHALLKDPNAVAVNMLRGVIALPSADQIRHIYQQTLEAHP